MINRDYQIEKAVENLIDSWDMDSLINFAMEDRLHYYLHNADDDEIKFLKEKFGGDND